MNVLKDNDLNKHNYDAGVVFVEAGNPLPVDMEIVADLIGCREAQIIQNLGLAMASSPN